jgi:hypothetical protein
MAGFWRKSTVIGYTATQCRADARRQQWSYLTEAQSDPAWPPIGGDAKTSVLGAAVLAVPLPAGWDGFRLLRSSRCLSSRLRRWRRGPTDIRDHHPTRLCPAAAARIDRKFNRLKPSIASIPAKTRTIAGSSTGRVRARVFGGVARRRKTLKPMARYDFGVTLQFVAMPGLLDTQICLLLCTK